LQKGAGVFFIYRIFDANLQNFILVFPFFPYTMNKVQEENNAGKHLYRRR